MPVRTTLLYTITRLAVYAAALIVLATARLPQPHAGRSVSMIRKAEPPTHAASAAWRLVIAGILLTGVALEIHRRRPVWH